MAYYELEPKWEEKSSEKKTVQMPSPGLLNLRGSKEKRDVSDLEKAAVFRFDLQLLQLSSGATSLYNKLHAILKGFMWKNHH